MGIKAVKIIGLIATVAGFGATILGDWAKEKQHKDEMIAEINKAVAEKFDNIDEESEEV